MDQCTMETLTSKRNTRAILQRAIAQELDEVLLDWALQAFIKLPDWLDHPWQEGQKPYRSKQDRVSILKAWLLDYGMMENLILDIAYAVLHQFEDTTLQAAIGTLATTLPYEDPFEAATMAGSLIALLQCDKGKGLYTLDNRSQERKMSMVVVNHWPDLAPAFAGAYAWINDTQFNLPLIEPPRKVKTNDSCGYHSIREPLLLGDFTQHDSPLNHEAINVLNAIEWSLDHFILNTPPVLPDNLDDKTADSLKEGIKVAHSYLKHRPFHLAWQYDSRGRLYSHGYHVNLQSFEWIKATLNLYRAERLTV